MKESVVLYGSYGYTGSLILKELQQYSLPVVLAGRDREKLKAQSEHTGYPFEVCDVSDEANLTALLSKAKLVIHCAGPFHSTAQPMVEACIKTKTHYTDITGEFQVFEKLSSYNDEAKKAGITIMPGVGFDVVPTDCLAAHLKKRLPDATHLQLAFTNLKGGLSRGTAYTAIDSIGKGSYVRENGELINIPSASRIKEINFGSVTTKAVCIPWGDITTAFQSTGIPNIEVYMGMPDKNIKFLKLSDAFSWLLKKQWVKNWLKRKINKSPHGPSDEKRKQGRSLLWGNVRNNKGEERTSYLETDDGYTLTSKTTAWIANNIYQNNFTPGYQTPAMAYGADLILEFKNTIRRDV